MILCKQPHFINGIREPFFTLEVMDITIQTNVSYREKKQLNYILFNRGEINILQELCILLEVPDEALNNCKC